MLDSVTHPQFDLYVVGLKSAFSGLQARSSMAESLENLGYGWLARLSDHEATYLTGEPRSSVSPARGQCAQNPRGSPPWVHGVQEVSR